MEEKKVEALKSNATIKERIQANREERSTLQLQTEQLNKAIGTISEDSAAESAGLREAVSEGGEEGKEGDDDNVIGISSETSGDGDERCE